METKVISISDGAAIPLLVSGVIPAAFRHGFTTRAGGVSASPFDTLNLGWKWGDTPANVDENHRRLLAAAGAATMFRASQVHGTRIVRVRRGDDPSAVAAQQADYADLDGAWLLGDDPFSGLAFDRGILTPPSGPGLGVEPNSELLAQF